MSGKSEFLEEDGDFDKKIPKTISLREDLIPKANQRAKRLNRKLPNYIETLVIEDLRKVGLINE